MAWFLYHATTPSWFGSSLEDLAGEVGSMLFFLDTNRSCSRFLLCMGGVRMFSRFFVRI